MRDNRPPVPAATLHILIALADQDRHGYAILRDIAQRTDGQFHLGPATLYTSIKRMLDSGLIEETDRAGARSADTRRRYYRLTKLGRQVAATEAERLDTVVSQARARFRLTRRKGRQWA